MRPSLVNKRKDRMATIIPLPNQITNTFASAARTLAKQLPPEIKAKCDVILGEDATAHEQWCLYDIAQTWTKINSEPDVQNA